MDLAVLLTYRCNSRCSMCNIWKYPSLPKEEVSLETLSKIPPGIDYLNLSGGEPTLRADLMEIVDLLYPKAMQLEISSNGLQPEKLEPVIKKYPNVKIRFSLEGPEELNNLIRGERNGYQTKVKGLLRLKELGGTDLGFGTVIQDANADQLVGLYQFCQQHCVEFAVSTLHNGYQFHKSDNVPYNRLRVARSIEKLIIEYLKSNSVKSWFRAYLCLGLISKVLGHERLIICSAGTEFVFLDPWGDMFACNVRPDLKLGNLSQQSWDEIMNGPVSTKVRSKVSQCTQNCWMVGSAKPAMRNPHFAKLPRLGPLMWVIENKLKVMLGGSVNFGKYNDYSNIYKDNIVPERIYYLDQPFERQVQTGAETHYVRFGEFDNH